MHALAPPLLNVPAGQRAGQAEKAPDVALKQPALTAVQLVAPAVLKVPAGHRAGQAEKAPDVPLKQPALTALQMAAPPMLYVPTGHTEGHAEVAPAEALKQPALTALQLVAPATALKVPIGHRLQVPVPVGSKLPGAQAAWAAAPPSSSHRTTIHLKQDLAINGRDKRFPRSRWIT
jgi:hypothetical protein